MAESIICVLPGDVSWSALRACLEKRFRINQVDPIYIELPDDEYARAYIDIDRSESTFFELTEDGDWPEGHFSGNFTLIVIRYRNGDLLRSMASSSGGCTHSLQGEAVNVKQVFGGLSVMKATGHSVYV